MSINKIKFDRERFDRSGNGFSNPYYIYEFQAPWGLEDDSKDKISNSNDKKYLKLVFESVLKEFVVKLRENIYTEKGIDVISLPLERIVDSAPLEEGEKLSEIIRKEELAELARLKAKYE